MKGVLKKLFSGAGRRFRALPPAGVATVTAVLALAFVGSSFAAVQTYDYIQHDNDFCVSCHLMQEPFDRFESSIHRDLGCKACHQPNPIDRTKMALRQIIANPGEITAHAEVPDARCAACHLEGDEDEWILVKDSRGHELHLNSMDPVLQELECVTCHSEAVHEFRTSKASCGARGCHSDAQVRLAEMAHLDLECGACHDFRAPLDPDPGAEDPASLSPTGAQCLSCHEMRDHFGPTGQEDPHEQQCGLCHNAHTQRTAADAVASCTEALCHAVPEKVDDDHHRWPTIRLDDCTRCHEVHTFTVDGDDCVGCHGAVIASAPLPDDPPEAGPAALRTGVLSGFLGLGWGWGAPGLPALSAPVAARAAVQSRSFQHERHRSVECRSCHTTGTSVVRGDPGWCSSCHHRNRPESACARCHRQGGNAEIQFPVRMTLPGGDQERELTFPHAGHASRSCSDCHGTPPGPVAQDFTCITCHDDHHQAETVDCLQCHSEPPRWAHVESLVHRTCSGGVCHQRLDPGPPQEWQPALCMACHEGFRGGEVPPLPRATPDTARENRRIDWDLSGMPLQKHP